MDHRLIVKASASSVLEMNCHWCRTSSLFLVRVRSLALSSTNISLLVFCCQKLCCRFLCRETKWISLFKNLLRLKTLNDKVFVYPSCRMSIILWTLSPQNLCSDLSTPWRIQLSCLWPYNHFVCRCMKRLPLNLILDLLHMLLNRYRLNDWSDDLRWSNHLSFLS